MHFILSNYGEKYIGYLLACMYSIQKSNHSAKITLLWQEMDDAKINTLQAFFENVHFVKTDFNFSKDEACRVSSKTLVIDYAMQNLSLKNGEKICIMDVDTVVVADLDSCFGEFDIGITDDTARETPLNSGVILIKFSEKIKTFSQKWMEATFAIFADTQKMKISLQRPYSGTDQMSLWKLLDYDIKKQNSYDANIDSEIFKIKKFHCKNLNHIYDGEVDKNVIVLHYKGVWNDFLLKGIIPSPSNFPKYKIFGEVFREALSELNKKLNTSHTQEFFNIRLHTLFYDGKLCKYGANYNIARNVYKIKNWLSKRFS